MLKITNLEYSIKKKKIISIQKLNIRSGEKLAIMGLNGSGKITLVEIILGIRKA